MLYLVTANYDNCETYEMHANWDAIIGITDSLELGKQWILNEVQLLKDDCEEMESYKENESEDGFDVSFHVISQLNELECYFEVTKIELNTCLIKRES